MKMDQAKKDELVEMFRTLLDTEEDVRVSMHRQAKKTTQPGDADESYVTGETLHLFICRGPVNTLETDVKKMLEGFIVTQADHAVRFCAFCDRQTCIYVTREDPKAAWCCVCQRSNGTYDR